MGEYTIGVPSSLVETVLRTPTASLEQAYRAGAFEFGWRRHSVLLGGCPVAGVRAQP